MVKRVFHIASEYTRLASALLSRLYNEKFLKLFFSTLEHYLYQYSQTGVTSDKVLSLGSVLNTSPHLQALPSYKKR